VQRNFIRLGLVGFVCVTIAWLLPVPTAHAGRVALILTGSSTVAPLVAEIAKRFETLHPGVRVDVQAGGSSRGLADARDGVADIGMVSRAPSADEQDLHARTIAQDGICMIAHRDNLVAELTDEQVSLIYTGQITNWRDVGGLDAPITVVNKAEGRSTLELFLHHFELKNSAIKPHVVIGDNEQGIKTVAGNPHAIGYVSIGTAEYDLANGVAIKVLPIGGVAAFISRPLNLVTREQPKGLISTFLDFAQSQAVHDIVRGQYFVPITK